MKIGNFERITQGESSLLNGVSLLQPWAKFYRASIKSFPDYKHLLQENCVE